MDFVFLILFGALSSFVLVLVAYGKRKAQHGMDMTRRYYLVHHPNGLKFDHVLGLMRAFGGLTTKPVHRYRGLITLGFEVEADITGIKFRISMPGHVADSVAGDLRSYGFGITHIQVEDEKWDEVVELRLTNHDRQLRLGNPESAIRHILSKLHPLEDGEKILVQWIAAPLFPIGLEDDKDHKEKHGDQTFQVIGRIATKGKDPAALKRRVQNGLSSLKAFGVRFKERVWIDKRALYDRINRRTAGHNNYGCTLNATELGVLAAYPLEGMNLSGLSRSRTRHLSADYRIPQVGFKVGMSNFEGAERPLAISPLDRTKHTYIVGPTGTGKSTLIANMAIQEILAGYGTAVFDPKGGDLIADVADCIPRERYGDVILFDPTDTNMPIGLNVLEGPDPYLITDQIMAVFDGLYDIYKMPRTADVLRSGVLTLAQVGMTLMDLPMLLAATEAGKDFRAQVMRQIPDRALRAFWQWFDSIKVGEQVDTTAPLLRRLRPFELRPSLRATLGQAKSGFDLKDVIANKKILLVSLAKGQLGEETSALFGSLIVAKLWNAVQARSGVPIADRDPFFCHIDEFHNYLHVPMSLADMLAESRAYGFGLTLAHQNLSQLPPQLRDAVLANARSKIVFQTAYGDARTMSSEFAPYISPEDLQNLGPYEVVMRLATGGEVSPPVTATTYAPGRPLGSGRAVRAASRATYGRPLAEVERELADRHKTFSAPKVKPSVGWVDESKGQY